MTDYQRIQKHLDGVSRSFAFCIKELTPPFRDEVALSYLLFRVLDTVEDYPWPSPEAQDEAYLKFLTYLEKDSLIENQWVQSFSSRITKQEKQLIKDCAFLSQFFKNFPKANQKIILRNLKNMVEGMKYFRPNSALGYHSKITDIHAFNTYCFFVAGIVGELLSELYKKHNPSFDYSKNKLKGIHFGLFLQKINILKDQLEDQENSRSWIHDRTEVLFSLSENAHNAYEYILDLPKNNDGYRLFCAWSFYLGLASLPYIERSWKEQSFQKIPKLRSLQLIDKIKKNINQDSYLENLYQEKVEPLQKIRENSSLPPATTQNLRIKYIGSIKPEEFQTLKIANLAL